MKKIVINAVHEFPLSLAGREWGKGEFCYSSPHPNLLPKGEKELIKNPHTALVIRIFLSLFLFIGLAPSAFPFASRPKSHGTCPVMPGRAVKEKFYVDYQGKRIYLCCRSCEKSFKKNPERYLKNLPDFGAQNPAF